MSNPIKPYPWGSVIVQVDDMIVYSRTVQLQTDEEVLEQAIKEWFPHEDDQN